LFVRVAGADEGADVSPPFGCDGLLEGRHDSCGVLEVGVVGRVGDVGQRVGGGAVIRSDGGGVEAECPDVGRAEGFAHVPADQAFGASDSAFTERMKGLDEGFEGGEEEVVWAGEAEGRVYGIVACGLGYAGIGQVPHCVCGGTQFGCVASGCVASFVVDVACDCWDVGNFAGFEEVCDGVCEGHVVDGGYESCRGAEC